MTDDKKQMRNKERLHVVLLSILAIVFFFGIGHNGYILEPDSYNYMECNFGREPLYPIFLLIFRTIFAEGSYLWAVWVAQSILAVYAVVYCTLWMKRRFRLQNVMLYVVLFLLLLPYWFGTIWYTPMGLWTNRILTEGLTFSIYDLFMVTAMKTIFDKRLRDFALTCLLGVVLSTLRSQMLVCFVICLGIMVWLIVGERKNANFKRICAGGGYCVSVDGGTLRRSENGL